MSKYILLFTMSFLFYQCTKETKKSATTEPTTEKTYKTTYVSAADVNKLLETHNDSLIVVNIWAEWCGPCKAEIPSFVKAQNDRKDKKFKLYFVNIDRTSVESTVEEFTNDSQMKNSLFLTQENAEGIATLVPEIKQGIPITIFLKNGKRENNIGMLEESILNQKLNEYLR